MKKDRADMYPIYPMPYMGPMNQGIPNMYQGMIPVNQMNQGMPILNQNNDVSSLSNQISALEKRVSTLESLVGNTNSYNTSSYQMM